MVLRKFRSTTLGKTSADIRTAIETKSERKERLPIHASIYPYYESKLGLPRVKTMQTIIKDPILTQTEYYKTQNRPVYNHQDLSRTKTSEFPFEKNFMGDKKNYNRNEARSIQPEVPKEKKVSKYHVSKEVEHQKATQETQLVHIERKSTLEGKVDLKKVADIRRTIRRRYANRNDFRKIFNQWDENSIGVLTPDDIYKMVNRIGIPININESKVLVASANKSSTGALNLNEFMGLIFDQDDKLNVDLSMLADEEQKQLQILDLHNLAVNKHTESLKNQLKTQLKDKIFGLVPQFTRKDKNKTGKINFEQFVSIMNNMDIPPSLSSDKNWIILYKELADTNGLDYKNFLESINSFNPPSEKSGKKNEENEEFQDENGEDSEKNEVETNTEKIRSSLKNDKALKLNISNRQKVPVNQLENFFVRARKIRLFLRDIAENEENLKKDLEKISENNVISLNSLKDYVISKLQEKKTLKITKKELEGFLSSYIYNKDGVTSVEDIAKNVFMEDTKASFELYQVKRPVPPIRPISDLDVNGLGPVKAILQSIEDKFYNQGSQKATEIFKKFDRDRDGFITKEDMQNALKIHQIVHSESDLENLMAFLDKNKKGYVNFHEFSEVIQPNIITINKEKLLEEPSKHLENHQPSLEFLSRQQKSLTFYKTKQEEFVKDFRPNEKSINLHANTRYGAKPVHQDTFVHYHMPLGSSLSQETLPAKKFVPFNVGAEEKMKKLKIEENKINGLKKTRHERDQWVRSIEENFWAKDSQKIYHRALSKEDYEKKCKLTSPFANMSIEHSLVKLIPNDYLTFDTIKKETSLTIENKSAIPIAFKVKTSSPKNFLVSPTTGIILPNLSMTLKISLLNIEEALQKSHKFLIQALPSTDLSKVNWNNAGIEEHKIPAKILSEEFHSENSENTESFEPVHNHFHKIQAAASVFQFSEKVREEVQRKTAPSESLREIASPEGKNMKNLNLKSNELASNIENLKNEVEKAGHKLTFTRELEKLTVESVGKYGLIHLIGAFILGFLLGYYII